MNTFNTFLESTWAERVGLVLLHSLWQIAAVAGVCAAVSLALRNGSANVRYVCGCVAMLAMLAFPMGTYVLLSQNRVPPSLRAATTQPIHARVAETSPGTMKVASTPTPAAAEAPAVGPATPMAPHHPASTVISPEPAVSTSQAPVASEPAVGQLCSSLRWWLPWATTAWILGVSLLSFRPVWGWLYVRRLQTRGVSPLPDELRRVGENVIRRLGLRRAVRLARSASVEAPAVVGHLRPIVLLPASAITGLSVRELELILTHELAHVRRHDYLVNLAQTMIEGLLFYHPGMWWVSSWIRRERENCCDDLAVATSGDRTTYVRALARLEEHRLAVPALGATGGSLLARVRRLLGKPNREFGYGSAAVWLAGLASLLVVVVLATGYADGSSQEESVAATQDEDDPIDAFVSAYKGPCDVAASPDGKRLYVAERDARALVVVNLAKHRVVRTIPLPSEASGVCVRSDGRSVYVTCGVARGLLCVVDTASGKVTAKIPVGHTPRGPSVSPDGKTAYVCNRFDNCVSVVDLVAKKEVARVDVVREPFGSAITPDGKTLFVTNHLPLDQADAYDVACEVTCIDTATLETKQIRLRNGATNLSGVCVSPDGKYVYAVGVLARYQMPRTQLERGWGATSTLSILDAKEKEYINTVLLDDIDLGAANPYDVATSDDGSTLYVSHAGTHEVSVIDVKPMLEKLLAVPEEPKWPTTLAQARSHEYSTDDVPNDLLFLTGMRRRMALEGVGPRGLAVVGNRIYCAMYFSDTLSSVALRSKAALMPSIALGPKPVMTEQRKGQLYFQDARLCFQQWLTCATCHPEGRTDSLNWDLMNDGMGNPKNTKSMLLAHQTPPMMISGVRADAPTAVRAAFRHIEFKEVSEQKAKAIDAYLKSLVPTPSPYLVDGELSESAQRGKALFESDEVGCATCHPAPLYTDLKMHELGRGQYDRRDDWDTPTLVECWRTAPYLHDGRHVTMKEVFSEGNHGEASDKLTDAEIDDLTEFVLSLSDVAVDEHLQKQSAEDSPKEAARAGDSNAEALPQQAVNRMLQSLLQRRHLHPELARLQEDVKHDAQVVDGGVRVSLEYELNHVAGDKTEPAGPKDAEKPWCRIAVSLRPDTGEATQLDYEEVEGAIRWQGMPPILGAGSGPSTRGYRVITPPMLISVTVETGSPKLKHKVNWIIDTELNAMFEQIDIDNPLGLDDDMLIKLYHTGSALHDTAMTCELHKTTRGRFPRDLAELTAGYSKKFLDESGNDPFAPGEKLRFVLNEDDPTLMQVWSVGPDGDWDGGRPIDSTKQPFDGDLGVELRVSSSFDWKYLADATILRHLEGKRLALYLGNKRLEAWKPELKAEEPTYMMETAPVAIPSAEPPKFAIHRVAAFRNGSGVDAQHYSLDDAGNNPEQYNAMRLKKHALDDLILDGEPLVTERDIVSYRWKWHSLSLTPEAYARLTQSVQPGDWGIPFVVQVNGQPIYQGTFYTTGSKYSTTMPAILLDHKLVAAPVTQEEEESVVGSSSGHIRIDSARVFDEASRATDLREDDRVLHAIEKASRLNYPRGAKRKYLLVIDAMLTEDELALGEPSESPSFWVDYEQLSKEALLERVAELAESSTDPTVAYRVNRKMRSGSHLTSLIKSLTAVGAKWYVVLDKDLDKDLGALRLDAVRAIPPTPDCYGALRGKVIGPDELGEPVSYIVTIEHETWANQLGEHPSVKVAAGAMFEFRNLPPGKYKVQAWPVTASGEFVSVAAQVEVIAKNRQAVEVELTCDKWFTASAEGESPEEAPAPSNPTVERALAVVGTVTGPDGHPIAGATVIQGSTWRTPENMHTVRTDELGRYRLADCQLGQTALTVTAPRMAPDVRPIQISPEANRVDFQLKQGRTIRLRIVDEEGKAVPGAVVYVRHWRDCHTLTNIGIPYRVDSEGRWVWTWAPDDPVELHIIAARYTDVLTGPISPRETEYRITLPPPLKISGRVLDAQTGLPIDRFGLVAGSAAPDPHDPVGGFGNLERASYREDGRYSLNQSVAYHAGACIVRVKAPGYELGVSRPIKSNEGDVRVDLLLNKTEIVPNLIEGKRRDRPLRGPDELAGQPSVEHALDEPKLDWEFKLGSPAELLNEHDTDTPGALQLEARVLDADGKPPGRESNGPISLPSPANASGR